MGTPKIKAAGHKTQPIASRAAELLFNDGSQPMLVIDVDTLEFLEVNQAALGKFAHSRDEFRNLRFTDIVPSEDRVRLGDALQNGRTQPSSVFEIRRVLENGQSVDVDLLIHHIRYAGRNAALVVPQDCTQRRQLEEQLQQAHKMEAVGMLAGGIAHDFNNLLTIITGYGQMLLASLPEHDENRNSVEQIIKAGERAGELTRRLLTFSRRQVVRPKALDLNTVVVGAAVMLRRLIGEHIELRIVEGPGLAKVHADPGQLEQVILNLAVNSRDAMSRGGTLIIETQNVDFEENSVGTNTSLKPGRYVMLAVTDTGSGMDAQTRSHLFEPFFTTKERGEGTGLGLSTVHGIVKQSGGEIAVYSEPGQGTCVKIYFPVVHEEPTEDTVVGEQERAGRGSETILLVEDDDAVRKLVRRALERQGYRVLVAAGGAEAIEIAGRHMGSIHLLISDVVMPQMSGRQVAEQLKALRPEIQVLYISGYTESAILRTGNLTKIEFFLQKPFTPVTLLRRVREMLDKAAGHQASSRTESGNS